jgi:hypothetical protein
MRPLLPSLLLACAPAVDAPDTIEEQVVFGFVHFDAPGHLEAVTDAILGFVADVTPELEEGFLVDQLDADDLEAVGVQDPDITGILGALGRAVYRMDLDQVAATVSDPDRAAWHEPTLRFDLLAEDGDRDCFLAQQCERYAMDIEEETQVPLLGTTTRTFTNEHRWVTGADSQRALVVRQLAPTPVLTTSSLFAVEQQYAFSVTGLTHEGVVRAESIWVDARVLGLELPEGFAVREAVKRMQKTADGMDEHLLGPPP